MTLAVTLVLASILVPPVCAVNQPLKALFARVGVGSVPTVALLATVLVDGERAFPPLTLNVTVRLDAAVDVEVDAVAVGVHLA